jgi:ribosomal protein S18 acetylase RimI-like enzyme
MIRLRVPPLDDLHLCRLIVNQLVPFAKQSQPNLYISKRSILQRLDKSRVFVTARQDHRPFGFISLMINHNVLFIDMLAVDPAAANKGWGKQLMHVGEHYGKQMGCNISQLFVDEINNHAINFYSKKGYEILEYIPLIRCYHMRKMI